MRNVFFPPEWYPQSCVQLTWPHAGSDWAASLDEVVACFAGIARAIAMTEKVLIVAPDVEPVRSLMESMGVDINRIIYREMPSNDTWARDHGGISVVKDGQPVVYDFTFNGWGMKFAANHDNLITRRLFASSVFAPDVSCETVPFVLEGGSIETDGCGTILTTARCLDSINRNEHMLPEDVDRYLCNLLGARRILRLHHGFIAGDDTDGHIDTLARFCSDDTIAYASCNDPADEHFEELALMEQELRAFTHEDGRHYRLVPLPMPDCTMQNGERLPATYANFLIINHAVLVPLYICRSDERAMQILSSLFPGREVIGIDCLPLIRQHGSLHCVTMQYPERFML